MKNILLLSALLFSQLAFADYTTGKRIVAADIIQGTKSQENFIKDSPPKAGVTKGWSCYADSAATRPENGTGGSPNVTWTATSTSPVKGPGAFVFTKDASNRQGQGCSYTFSVDVADRAKVLDIEAEYLVNSGTFVAGNSSTDSDVIVYIYDVTNSALIEPSSIKLLSNSTTLSDTFKASFQTSATGSSYRLIFHVASTSASAYALKFGDISVAKSKYTFGTPITDWTTWTPTGSWSTNTSYAGLYRRVGDSYEYQVYISLAGAPTSATLTVNLPSGHTVDSTKVIASTDSAVGFGRYLDSGSHYGAIEVDYATTTTVGVRAATIASPYVMGQVTQAFPVTFANSDKISLYFKLPIVGLSSSVQTSDQTSNRVVSFVGTKTGNESVTANTTNIAYSSLKDTHAGWSGTTYTVPVAGDYVIHVSGASGTATNLVLYLNGSANKGIGSLNATTNSANSTVLYGLAVGNTISVRATGSVTINGDGNATNTIGIHRISGPNQIAASETVAARAYKTGNQTGINPNSSFVKITFDTRDYDTHSAFDTTNNRFVAPTSGIYRISAAIFIQTTNVLANTYALTIYKNGSVAFYGTTLAAIATNFIGPTVSGSLRLNAGDYVETHLYGNGNNSVSTLSMTGGSTVSSMSVERIGL